MVNPALVMVTDYRMCTLPFAAVLCSHIYVVPTKSYPSTGIGIARIFSGGCTFFFNKVDYLFLVVALKTQVKTTK